jgi:hypothetical protein
MFELQCGERSGGQRNVKVGPSGPADDGVLQVTLNPGDVGRAAMQERPLDLTAEALRIVENRCRWHFAQPKRRAIPALWHADRVLLQPFVVFDDGVPDQVREQLPETPATAKGGIRKHPFKRDLDGI